MKSGWGFIIRQLISDIIQLIGGRAGRYAGGDRSRLPAGREPNTAKPAVQIAAERAAGRGKRQSDHQSQQADAQPQGRGSFGCLGAVGRAQPAVSLGDVHCLQAPIV